MTDLEKGLYFRGLFFGISITGDRLQKSTEASFLPFVKLPGDNNWCEQTNY
jgi:hypothetical protein